MTLPHELSRSIPHSGQPARVYKRIPEHLERLDYWRLIAKQREEQPYDRFARNNDLSEGAKKVEQVDEELKEDAPPLSDSEIAKKIKVEVEKLKEEKLKGELKEDAKAAAEEADKIDKEKFPHLASWLQKAAELEQKLDGEAADDKEDDK